MIVLFVFLLLVFFDIKKKSILLSICWKNGFCWKKIGFLKKILNRYTFMHIHIGVTIIFIAVGYGRLNLHYAQLSAHRRSI